MPLSHFLRWRRGPPQAATAVRPWCTHTLGRCAGTSRQGEGPGLGTPPVTVSREERQKGRRKQSLAPCASLLNSTNCPPAGGRAHCTLPLHSGTPVPCRSRPRAVGANSRAASMTDVLPQPDCSLKAVCEPLERCCLDQLEEPGSKRPPNTGARLWGRVRSKLLRQKVLVGVRREPEGGYTRGAEGGWGLPGCSTPSSWSSIPAPA